MGVIILVQWSSLGAFWSWLIEIRTPGTLGQQELRSLQYCLVLRRSRVRRGTVGHTLFANRIGWQHRREQVRDNPNRPLFVTVAFVLVENGKCGRGCVRFVTSTKRAFVMRLDALFALEYLSGTLIPSRREDNPIAAECIAATEVLFGQSIETTDRSSTRLLLGQCLEEMVIGCHGNG